MNVAVGVAANVGATGQTMGPRAGNATMRGAAGPGWSPSDSMSGIDTMPKAEAAAVFGAMPSFSELMLQQGAMAGAHVQAPGAEGTEDFADGEESNDAPAVREEGVKSQVGDGLPAICSLESEGTSAAMGAMSGKSARDGATMPGKLDGSGSEGRRYLPAPRLMASTGVALLPVMSPILMKTQRAGQAVISKLSKPATPSDGKNWTVTRSLPSDGANAAVVTNRAAAVVAPASSVSAQAPAVHDREATPAANGSGAPRKLSGALAGTVTTLPAAPAQSAAAPAAGKGMQSGSVQDATNAKELPPQSEVGNARVKGEESSFAASATTGVSSTEVAAHKSADMAHAVMLAGTAVSPAGQGQVMNSVETGLSATAVTSAGAALLHGAVSGTIAEPSSAGHATAGATFARMDAAAAPVVTESSPQRLAVGVRDAGLGWVEIRTHAAGGQVSAVLTAASSEGQAALSAHLPEVREYLAGQHVRIDQLSSERWAPGDGEGSGREPSGNAANGQAGNAQTGSARAGSADAREQDSVGAMFVADGESLSYINVRV